MFGMGTGVTSLPSSLDLHMDVLASALQHGCCVLSRSSIILSFKIHKVLKLSFVERVVLSKLDKRRIECFKQFG